MPTIMSILLALPLTAIPLLYTIPVSAQETNATSSEQGEEGKTLHVTKNATNSYRISSSGSFVSSFDTTYAIQGSVASISASKDLIVSTIIKDYDSSPTIGYVNDTSAIASSIGGMNQPTLPNPFASEEKINEKIKSEINTSIDNAATKSPFQDGEIKCRFGMSLDDFKCSFHDFVTG
jgi:hypothetical protein